MAASDKIFFYNIPIFFLGISFRMDSRYKLQPKCEFINI